MNKKERLIISGILLLISLMTIFDLLTDLSEGVVWWHVTIEGIVALMALVGVYFLVKGTFTLRKSLRKERELSAKLTEENTHWKESSKRFLDGLSKSIDTQLDKWQLTKSEKEVAFLLIKGFSLKEIAEYRSTVEKTTRSQAASIYAKSGVSGRSQLSAFFLEDLLIPQPEK
ncbi:helix-turn-helix transcriptional regulator [Halobacteriovorax sp. GFR7]|uniref:helix-turn-helix transcriptional regulator n=1 Tax=unclassified Halobacteriovorax TaxID=2639665 RepID=UPI00371378AA